MFAGRYDAADPSARPRYGALNRHDDPYGGSIRFGSAYLRLRPEAIVRGPEIVALAQDLGDELDPSVIGDAGRAGHHDPQSLKRVWHLLARFGRS